MCILIIRREAFFTRGELNCSSEYRPRHCVIMWDKRWFLKAFVASKYSQTFLGFKRVVI